MAPLARPGVGVPVAPGDEQDDDHPEGWDYSRYLLEAIDGQRQSTVD